MCSGSKETSSLLQLVVGRSSHRMGVGSLLGNTRGAISRDIAILIAAMPLTARYF